MKAYDWLRVHRVCIGCCRVTACYTPFHVMSFRSRWHTHRARCLYRFLVSLSDGYHLPTLGKPFLVTEDDIPPPRPPPMENRYPLRSFSLSGPNGNGVPKHIGSCPHFTCNIRCYWTVDAVSSITLPVKPQPINKPPPMLPDEPPVFESDSPKRPPRPPYANRNNSHSSSISVEPLKLSMVRSRLRSLHLASISWP